MFCDAHMHLSLFPDPAGLLARLRASLIVPLAVSRDAADSARNAALSERLNYPFMVGVHPARAPDGEADLALLRLLASGSNCVGIGECGLDSREGPPREAQERLLEAQLELSCELGKPVSLHIRGCHGRLLGLLRAYKGRLAGAVHGFTFSRELARDYLDLGLYLSVGHHLLNRRTRLRDLLKFAPHARILLETDSDGAAGPYDLSLIRRQCSALAGIWGTGLSEVTDVISLNVCSLLKRKENELSVYLRS